MNSVRRFYQSSLGKKYIMALTGLALFVFVIAHLAGNLQIFLGPRPINDYAAFLKSKPALLWSTRIALLLIVIIHIAVAIQLALRNRASRPVSYGEYKPVGSSLAAQTILFSGAIILAFVVYHLLHFTFGVTHPDVFDVKEPITGRHDVYRMMVMGFSNVWVAVIYLISTGLLCLHLSHGVSSLFQSLGLRKRAYVRNIDLFAKTAALLVFLGNCAIPIAILAGYVK